MIICLSSDPQVKKLGERFAKFYKEQFRDFEENCFKDIGNDTRITFTGHADLGYGDEELTPEAFVAKLLAYKLPQQVKILDLYGCRIGEGNLSFAHKVTELLVAKDFPDIRVNVFSSNVSPTKITDLAVVWISALTWDQVALRGLTDAGRYQYEKEMHSALEKEPLKSQIKRLETLTYSKNPNYKAEIDELKNAIEFEIALLEEKFFKKYAETFYSHPNLDIRKALDQHPTFKIDQASLEKEKKLIEEKTIAGPERLRAIKLINIRIGKLNAELQGKKSWFNFWGSSRDEITYQINILDNMNKLLSDSSKDLSVLKSTFEKILVDKKFYQYTENQKLLEDLKQIFWEHYNPVLKL